VQQATRSRLRTADDVSLAGRYPVIGMPSDSSDPLDDAPRRRPQRKPGGALDA
jgi:hypothetical protein